jgi:O-antigen/teichoic acid export membrane protein
MLASSLTLLQQPGISWTVWGLAILAFLAATVLVVYTFRKMRRGEKEEIEDWSLSSKGLFAHRHQISG